MKTKKTFIIIVLTYTLTFSINSLGDTCPQKTLQTRDGYLYSTKYPGWISTERVPRGMKLSANNFSAAVFSPKKQRIVCVYQIKPQQWIALMSIIHPGLQPDLGILTPRGQKAWVWSKQHHDYSCGQPDVFNINDCPFTIEENKLHSSS